MVDKLTQIADELRWATEESEQAIHSCMDIVTSLGKMNNELGDSRQSAESLLEQLKQLLDRLAYTTNQSTKAINKSTSSKSQDANLLNDGHVKLITIKVLSQ
jgi:ABC-type transporter Mla subunit MlaD